MTSSPSPYSTTTASGPSVSRSPAGRAEFPRLDCGAEHCLAAEENIAGYPFLTGATKILTYHHENYTRVSLAPIDGFEFVTDWASNHHAKLDGSGYPYQKRAADLDFNSRLLACFDIYQALTEERPYRRALSHGQTMEILRGMVADGKIEGVIVEDLDKVFAEAS